MPRKSAPRPFTIRSKIVGVTFDNPDGTSRQHIIERYCAAGMELEIRPEPNNRFDKNALGVWVRNRGFIGPRHVQVGHLRAELAEEFSDLLRAGWDISGWILEVTGGGRNRNFGVNIELHLTPPGTIPAIGVAAPTGQPSALPHIGAISPEPIPPALILWSVTAIGAVILSFFSLILGSALVVVVTIFSLRRLILSLARKSFIVAKRLLERFVALSPPWRITIGGAIASVGGILLWMIGFVVDRLSESPSILRPTGFVTLIVGLGVSGIAIVFSLSEPSQERDEKLTGTD